MKTQIMNRNCFMFILVALLMGFGVQGSYAQTITASTPQPLTEANLHGSVVTLTLSGGTYERSHFRIENAVMISGIDGVTFDGFFGVDRASDTEVTIELEYAGNIDADGTLAFTVGAGAIAGYNGNALTATVPVIALEESLDASTALPLTEATLHGSIITLTLSGRHFADEWDIGDAVSISGIDGVTFERWEIDRVSDTKVTIELTFLGDFDTDATLTLTVGADAIGGYDEDFTFQFPVTAVEESLEASTESPLTEATLHGSIITLTLSGRHFADEWDIGDAVSISGIDGVTFERWEIDRVSDTKVTIELTFLGDFDTDATLTLTVGADAIGGYDEDFTFQFPVTAVEESLEASTESPLTEATLHGSIITLTLSGRHFVDEWDIGDAVSISGIDGVTIADFSGIDRVSDTVTTLALSFEDNIDADGTLTLTVGADAISYNQDFTFQFPVTAVEESLEASTESPLTEATLHGSIITLTLSGRHFVDEWDIGDAVSISGIDGVTIADFSGIDRVSDTVTTLALSFEDNIDADGTLTLTVGADAISYNQDFTFQFPVTAVEESLVVSAGFSLTEASLHGSPVTLTLAGRRFAYEWEIADAVSVSGIEGVSFEPREVERVSDTEARIILTFSGSLETDATLTFTVDADAILGYNQGVTAQFSVTAIEKSNATVSISPASVVSPDVGEELTFSLNIAGGENVAGFQAVVSFEESLRYVESANGDYLPADAFFESLATTYYTVDPSFGRDVYAAHVAVTGTTFDEAGNGSGTLATLTFKVVDFKASTLTLSQVYLVDSDGKRWEATTENGMVTIPPEPEEETVGDINRDGVVDILDLTIVSVRFGKRGQNSADLNGDGLVDIVDLVLVASEFGGEAAAPSLYPQALELLTAADVQGWLSQAQQLALTDPTYLRGINVLEQLLAALTPKETILLPNYPNPFNPETWIPYHLSNDANVKISIYDTRGELLRWLDLGHQIAGYYADRGKAAYWDGRNEFGEQVASGVYFYHLSAGDYSATRKMLILK